MAKAALAALALLSLVPHASSFAATAALKQSQAGELMGARALNRRTTTIMQGAWSSPRGENRHDLARDGREDGLPGRPGGDGRVGGSEDIRLSPGARRMTPAERIDAMVSPMETGVVSNQLNAKGISQKQTLQDAISAGDDWWAGDAIDLKPTTSLPADWVQEQSAGATYFRNTVTGVTTRTRPQVDAGVLESTPTWARPGHSYFDETLDRAFPCLYESIGELELPVQVVDEADQVPTSRTETLVRRHVEYIDKIDEPEPQSGRDNARGRSGLGEEDETGALIGRIMQVEDEQRQQQQQQTAAASALPGVVEVTVGLSKESAGPVAGAIESRYDGSPARLAAAAGEEEPLIKLIRNNEEEDGGATVQACGQVDSLAPGDAGTETILRKIEAAALSGAGDLAPIQGIDAEGDLIQARDHDSTALGAANLAGFEAAAVGRGASRQVPEHLRPGNNAGQMNWAERQLAEAQQQQRPLSDLPGFAANFLKSQVADSRADSGGVGQEDVFDETPAWNPLPLIDPETGKLRKSVAKRRVLKTAADVPASSNPAAGPVEEAMPRSEEQQMDDVLQVLYKDGLEMLEVRNAGIDGKSSSALLSANGLVSSRALRARSGALYPPWRICVRLAPVCCRVGGEGGEGRGCWANAGPGWCWCRGVAAVCSMRRPWLSGGFIFILDSTITMAGGGGADRRGGCVRS